MTDDRVAEPQAILAFLRAAGAEGLGHAGGRTLLSHLRGTAEIVGRWGQPEWLQRAALIHSVYGTEAYQEQLIATQRRSEVAAVAGPRAERLAHLFSVTPRRPLFAGTHRWARGLSGADATPDELDALVLLHMANLADQAAGPGGAPGRWLVRLRDLGDLLDDSETIAAPDCAGRLADLTDEDEAQARRSYAQAAHAFEPDRTAALALAATACPAIAEPRVWLAHLAACRGEGEASRSWARQAHTRLMSLGTPWDKRLSFSQWLEVIEELGRAPALPGEAAAIADPRELHRTIVHAGAPGPRPAVAAAADPAGRRRFERYVQALADPAAASAGGAYPELASRPWHNPHDFALARHLESHFTAIRAEIMALDGAAFHRESERIGRTGEWDVAFLHERGRRHDVVCAACPVTASAVESHRTIRSMAGLIYVSRLRPGTHIAPHRGPTNLRLRCHLGIAVPDGDCAIRVGEQTERWQEGRCLVFDDFYDHEAWNHADEGRIVLIVDLWHPGLSDAEVRLLEGLHAYTYRHARRLSRYWSANAAAAGEAERERSAWA